MATSTIKKTGEALIDVAALLTELGCCTVTTDDVLDCLSGALISEEDVGDIKRYLSEEF